MFVTGCIDNIYAGDLLPDSQAEQVRKGKYNEFFLGRDKKIFAAILE